MLPIKKGFTIYQSEECPYCRESLEILHKLETIYKIPYLSINFNKVKGGKDAVLDYFNRNSEKYRFDSKHQTKPIIFFNCIFIGGNSQLKQLLQDVLSN